MIARAEIEKLTPQEKLDLLQTLWESFVSDPESLPVTDAEKRELRTRSQAHRTAPKSSLSEGEFKQRLRERLGYAVHVCWPGVADL